MGTAPWPANAVPTFPERRHITSADREWYENFYYTSGLAPYADISFPSLLSWFDLDGNLKVSHRGRCLVVSFTDPFDGRRENFVPLGPTVTDDVIAAIMDFQVSSGNTPLLREIPLTLCRDLDPARWDIEEDVDNSEYVLDVVQQTDLVGHDMSRQRRRIGQFQKGHADDRLLVEHREHIDDATKERILTFIHTMPLNNKEEAQKANTDEVAAIEFDLAHADAFEKQALLVSLDGRLISIALFEQLGPDAATVNHLKVDYTVPYIFQYTIYLLAKLLRKRGIGELNLEQDLGSEGIRTFKQRMHPSRMLQKVIITPQEQ